MNSETITKKTINKNAPHPLQSFEWGEFRGMWGNTVVRFPFGQMTVHKLPYTPWSVGSFSKGPEPTGEMLQTIREYGVRHNLLFIKLEPNILIDSKNFKGEKHLPVAYKKRAVQNKRWEGLLKKYGCVPGKTLFTPTTFWIDLTKSEEELLASFHPKTRYNARLAEKKGVTVVEDNSKEAFKKYLSLTDETARRQGFYAHTKKYHELMWKTLHTDMVNQGEAPIARLMTAKYNGEILTTWILFVWKDFLYYPYGASSDKHREVMASNLMMWESIRLGKRLGLKVFDLWGREEGKGFTPFKEGYRPDIVTFMGSWDLVINSSLYKAFRGAEWLRWKLLRLKRKLLH